MNRILRLSLIPFWILALVACTRSASFPPGPESDSTALPPLAPASPFPMALSSTWIYEMEAHTEGKTARWRLTQTIVEVGGQAGTLTARVEQRAELLTPPASASGQFFRAQDTNFWYILAQNKLYRSDSGPDYSSHAWGQIEIVWPPESLPCWCVGDNDGCLELPDNEIGPGCRYQASAEAVTHAPAGDFYDCRQLVRNYNNGTETLTFCPNAGILNAKFEHLGSDFGYEMTLVGYLLPDPQ